MADFIIIVATLAAIASPDAGLDRAPTLGFRVYPSQEACAEAILQNTAPPGSRLVCVPVEPPPGGLNNAH